MKHRESQKTNYSGEFRKITHKAGIPKMIMAAWEIESLSDEEILELACREHINLRKYE